MIIQDATFVTNPVVSVLVCSYNQEATIAQTLEGILMQDFTEPFEIVVGEDGSSDRTAAICREYQARFPHKIKLLLHESNIGLMANFKANIAVSRGKYVAFCGGDDYWIHGRKLSMQYAFLEENDEFGLVHTRYNVLHVESGLTEEIVLPKSINPTDTKGLLKMNCIGALSVMTEAGLVKQAINEGLLELGFLMEDYPLWLYITEKKKMGYLDEITVVWRKNNESISNTRNQLKYIRFNMSIADVRNYFAKRFGRIDEMREELVSAYRSIQYWAFYLGDKELATICLDKLKHLNGAHWKAYVYGYPFLQRLMHRFEHWNRPTNSNRSESPARIDS